MNKRRTRPRYIRVGNRDVHLHVVGEGRLLVALHASPGSGRALLPFARSLDGWQVLVLDTPGCGRSDPLSVPEPAMDDYARATLATLDALGVDHCAVFGTHTGAKIALALAHLAPARISGLVLDGLGISTQQERHDQLENYTPRHEIKADGTHLISAWHQVRDMALFWPWYAQDGRHRMKITPPSAESIHEVVIDMLRNLDHYALTYHAAFRHDPLPRLASLAVPTLIRAAPDDPLRAHLDRVGRAPDHVTIDAQTGTDSTVRLLEWLGQLSGIGELRSPEPTPSTTGSWRTYLGSGDTVVHATVSSPPAARSRPLVALHACPSAGDSLQPLAQCLADERLVVRPDLPGLGGSSWPWSADVDPGIEELSGMLGPAVADFIGERADIYGTHSGAAVALEWAQAGVFPAANVVLDGLLLGFPESARAEWLSQYASPLVPVAHGMHMLEAWHRVRDELLFWPWYRQEADAVRSGGPDPTPALIHELTVQMLSANLTYPLVCRAAFRYLAETRLQSVAVPTILTARAGDPLAVALQRPIVASPLVQVRPDALRSGLDSLVGLLREVGEARDPC
jgi:pimeloyl-ACP methyl ester carboxylesterase